MRNRVAGFQRHRGKIANLVFVISPKGIVENLAPSIDHRLDETVSVKRCVRWSACGAAGVVKPSCAMDCLHSPFNKWRQASLKMVEAALNPFQGLFFCQHPILPTDQNSSACAVATVARTSAVEAKSSSFGHS